VATLSLGSPSEFFLAPKTKSGIVPEKTIKRAERAAAEGKVLKESKRQGKVPMLQFVTQHGDMIVMHGTKLHENYVVSTQISLTNTSS